MQRRLRSAGIGDGFQGRVRRRAIKGGLHHHSVRPTSIMVGVSTLAVGPIRQNRMVYGIAYPLLFSIPVLADEGFRPGIAAAVVVGLVCGARAAMMRIELHASELVVVNFFQTVHVDITSIAAAGFAAAKWDGFAVPLVLIGKDMTVRANGVSAWSRRLRWPDQSFVKSERTGARIEAFFDGSGIAFNPREPVRTARP